MSITANLADGRSLVFPDDTDPMVIQRTVYQTLGLPTDQGEQALTTLAQGFQAKPEEGTLIEAISAGMKYSVFGTVATRGSVEQQQKDYNWYQRAATNAVALVADVPFLVMGGAAGALGGTAIAPGIGTVAGAGAGAFALPEAIRQTLIEGYGKGWFQDWGDFWTRFTSSVLKTGKAAALGAAIGPAGAVGKVAVPATAPALAKTAAQLTSEVTAMSGLGAAMEGRVPNAQDFLDNAILLGGAKLAFRAAGVQEGSPASELMDRQIRSAGEKLAGKLRDTYAKTGLTPAEIVEEAGRDPTIIQDLASDNREIPSSLISPTKPEKEAEPKAGEPVPEVPGETKPTPRAAPNPKVASESARLKIEVPEGTNAAEVLAPIVNGEKWDGMSQKAQRSIFERAIKNAEPTLGAGQPPVPPEPPQGGIPAEPGRSNAENSILSRIVEHPEKPRRTFTEWWHSVYNELIDESHRIMQEQREAGVEKGELGPYEIRRLNAGIAGKAAHFLEFSPLDPRTYANVAQSYKSVLEMVKDDPKGFEAYIVAKHAIEREAAGKATGIDLAAARQVLADGAGRFEAAAQARIGYKDALLDYALKSGLIPPERVQAMRNLYKAHVPLYRLFEGEERATGGRTPRDPIKRAIGSERQILDPITSDIRDTYLIISLAEQNMARQEFVALGEPWAKRIKQPIRSVTIQPDELQRILGEDVSGGAEALTVFRAMQAPAGKNEIVVMQDGKRQVYTVNPDVARAFNGLDAGGASFVSSVLRTSASWLRSGVTLSPDFASRNVIRDALSSFVYVGSHPIKTIKGAISYFKEDAAYQNWLKGGGANAAMVSIDRHYIEKHLYELQQQTGFMDKAWNLVKTPFEALAIVSETLENVTRLGIARDQLMQAKDKAQIQALSYLTREGTVDFARHGADPFFRQWTLATAFMNPALQGMDRMVRAFKNNPVGTTAKAVAAITLPSLLLWWKNHDDPRWKDIPDWERDLFWIAFTDKWELPASDDELMAKDALGLTKEVNGQLMVNNGHTYRIPKPFELGVMFGSVPERVLDAYVADKPDAFRHFASSMANIFGINIVPTVMLPPFQQMTNFNMFTDRPLVPDSMKQLLPEYQYTPFTTEATKTMGQIIGSFPGLHDKSFASPLIIDNYIRGWSGTLGSYVVQLADLALRKTGALPDPVMPTKHLADLPVIKAFMVRYPDGQTQVIQDFYENYEKADKINQTVRRLGRMGEFTAAEREMMLGEENMLRLQQIRTGLGTASRFIQLVYANKDLNGDEKRQLIDSAYGQMIVQARAGNETMRAYKNIVRETETIQ